LNTSLKFLYFDVDDTILDHRRAERLALAETYNLYTVLQKADLEDFRERYHHINVELWQKYGLREIDRPYLEYHRFADTLKWFSIEADPVEIRNTYMNLYRAKWGWVDQAEAVLTRLSESYAIGFLTNGFSEIQRWKAEKFDLHRFGDNYIISEDVGHMKPSAEIFEFATQKAGCLPSEILYIGDSFVSDVQGGAAFGWKTAWFNRDKNPDPEKVKVADFIFDDFTKLPGLIDSFEK
jgi:putative hydrolase of the HAD superfamily